MASSRDFNAAIPPERMSVIDDVKSTTAGARLRGELAGSGLPELQLLAKWLDSVFTIPGTKLSFGLDALLGLIPGLGDTLTTLFSLYILQEAGRRGVPRVTMARMAVNTGIDYVVGAVPFLGDVFDVFWKANEKNVELLRRHVEAYPEEARRQQKNDWMFVAGLSAALVTMLVGSVTIAWWIVMTIASALR